MIRINLAPVEARRRMPAMSLSLPSFNLGILFGILYFVAVAGLANWHRSRRRSGRGQESRSSSTR